MPKKFQGENSKAAEARARKSAAKEAEDTKKKQQIEDEYWRDDDKHVLKKQQRKEDKEKKKTEQLERKKELQKLHDEEQASIKSSTKQQQTTSATQSKVTRIQAEAHKQAIAAAAAAASKEEHNDVPVTDKPLEENVNRLAVEGEEARTVDEALSLLSTKETVEIDMHPEKRMKAAYLAYEEKYLPLVKEENPGLRLSQLKQIIRKDWNKSPENPLNQQQNALAISGTK